MQIMVHPAGHRAPSISPQPTTPLNLSLSASDPQPVSIRSRGTASPDTGAVTQGQPQSSSPSQQPLPAGDEDATAKDTGDLVESRIVMRVEAILRQCVLSEPSRLGPCLGLFLDKDTH